MIAGGNGLLYLWLEDGIYWPSKTSVGGLEIRDKSESPSSKLSGRIIPSRDCLLILGGQITRDTMRPLPPTTD